MADDFKFGTPFTPDMISKFNASIQPQRMIAESIAAEQDRKMSGSRSGRASISE